MTSGPAREALDKMVAASTELRHPSASALVQLGQILAAQMDDAGSQPSTRLSAAYLSVLVNLRRLSPPESREQKPASRLAFIQAQAREIRGTEWPSKLPKPIPLSASVTTADSRSPLTTSASTARRPPAIGVPAKPASTSTCVYAEAHKPAKPRTYVTGHSRKHVPTCASATPSKPASSSQTFQRSRQRYAGKPVLIRCFAAKY